MLRKGSSIIKARKGVVKCKITYDDANMVIIDLEISGDFFLYPEDAIYMAVERLKGAPLNRDSILKIFNDVFNIYKVKLAGISPEDFAKAILEAVEGV